MTRRTPFGDLPRAQQAGILCNDAQFQGWVAHLRPQVSDIITPSICAEQIRLTCGVNSRADLNKNEVAAARFDAMRTDFDAWRGKIARP